MLILLPFIQNSPFLYFATNKDIIGPKVIYHDNVILSCTTLLKIDSGASSEI
jgi:hypothetical protein